LHTSVRDALSYSRVSKSREWIRPVRMVPKGCLSQGQFIREGERGGEIEIK